MHCVCEYSSTYVHIVKAAAFMELSHQHGEQRKLFILETSEVTLLQTLIVTCSLCASLLLMARAITDVLLVCSSYTYTQMYNMKPRQHSMQVIEML